MYEPAVFTIHNPKCKRCAADLEFQIIENFDNTGSDWVQWYCTRGCGFHITAEIT